ncbi:MAG TPA: CDP-glucose 4,6-dehydratase [Solirubrobacteraceae bacterium]|nr:CDP-glucose 4,6-dehydratase [Solirubrobacteraceae bacterium]
MIDPSRWQGRRVLITGHTGFKGAWLALWLQSVGAEVTGLSRGVPTTPSLYELARVGSGMAAEHAADVRDAAAVAAALGASAPEVVLHLAAQPFVRRSFREPRETYETNVLGTVNVLEAVREAGGVQAVIVVTSDKCYDNREHGRAFVEEDPMGGHDPYSNSKGCAELVTDAYRRSFFSAEGPVARVASGRAGNVIGGGDWGEDRLIPDIMRAALGGAPIPIRNPEAVRPWQHVLNPLGGYLRLAEALGEDPRHASGWNFGPAEDDVRPVRWIADRLTELWPGELRWELDPGPHPHEARHLALDSTKARRELGWAPAWDLEEALARIVEWYRELDAGGDMRAVSLAQIERFAATASAVA